MQKQKNQKQIVYADVAIHDMPEKVSYKAKESQQSGIYFACVGNKRNRG